MAKRFTDTEKWNDKWFRSLPPLEKLCFNFLCDRCDIAGFYELDFSDIAFRVKTNESNILGAIKGLSRGLIIEVGKDIGDGTIIWIKNFLFHQRNLPLNPDNHAHKGIIFLITKNIKPFPKVPELLGANKGLFRTYGKGNGNSNGLKEDEFDKFWDLYAKKVGDKEKLLKKFSALSDKDISDIMKYIPKYKKAQPDKKFRKNPETFLNNKSWLDEIIVGGKGEDNIDNSVGNM